MNERRYRVLSGTHRQDGQCFHKGEVVTSTRDLEQVFPGKFELVREELPRAAKAPVGEPEPAQADKFEIESCGGRRYNVRNVATGKAVNDIPLTKREAQELERDLNAKASEAAGDTQED